MPGSEGPVDVEQLDRVLEFWPNSLTLIGSSRLALIAMRRKLATDTPGIDTGYWKARNSPDLARSCGSASVMSSPLNMILPSVTS